MEVEGKPSQGVLLPASSVLRFDGTTCVYVEESPGTYRRKVVNLERPVEGGWFTTTSLVALHAVVTSGAQAVLSEELRSRIELEEEGD
jgi:hypothetical protein